MTSVMRDVLLRMAGGSKLRRAVETPSMEHDIVRKYVAGPSISSAIDAASWLVARGRLVSLTHLASDPHDALAAQERRKRIRKVIRRLSDAGLTGDGRADVSLRLAALGAAMGPAGPALAVQNARFLADAAAAADVSLTVETERDVPVDTTISAVHAIREEHPETGVSLQACLLRTEDDCRDLVGTGVRVRLTKGAASADPAVYASGRDVDRAYVRCLKILMPSVDPLAVATHDGRLLEIAQTLAGRVGRNSSNLEYQLPYGVHPRTQATISDRGDRLRVYVPFGEECYPYIVRRVADSPTEIFALARAVASR